MNKIVDFNISVNIRCLNAFWKKRYYADCFWFIAKKRYDILNIILRCNSIVFIYYKNYKDKKAKCDAWYAALIILNFISTVRDESLSLSLSLSLSHAVRLVAWNGNHLRLLPNVGEGEKKRSFQSTCIGCTVNRNINRYTSRPMRRFH